MHARPYRAYVLPIILLLVVAQLDCLATEQSTTSRQPHIVILLADDLGWGDVGYHGSEIKTPHIDALAAAGTRLSRFYVMPVCSPTRGALMTGRYPSRLEGLGAPLHTPSKNGLTSGEITMAEILKSKGYTTACIGKWHLGHQPEHYPTRHGFDYYYGTPLGHMFSTEAKHKKAVPSDLYLRNEKEIDFPPLADLTSELTKDAVRWISQNKDTPFFLDGDL